MSHEIVPSRKKSEDSDDNEGWTYQGQHNMPVDAEKTAAVETRGIFQVAGNALEKLAQQKNAEGGAKETHHPKRLKGVVPAKFLHDQELRNHCYLRRNHHRAEQGGKADTTAGPLQTGEGISGDRTTKERANEVEDNQK